MTHINASTHISRRALLALAASVAGPSFADTYPSKPVTLICPYPAGTASDITAREFAQQLSAKIGQNVIVMNRAGAGGIIGTKFVATSLPDGYTLLVGAIGTQIFNPVINPSTNYDAVKDFSPISRFVSFPNVLVVPTSLKVNSVSDLVKLAKERASKPLIYGTGGNGTTSHISAAQFGHLANVELVGVNFQGTSAAVIEAMTGRVDFVFGNINIAVPHIKSGALKALAICSGDRYDLLPSVPTFKEAGMPEMQMTVWSGLLAPAGTAPAIVSFLNKAVKEISTNKALMTSYKVSGATLDSDTSPEAFAKLIEEDRAKYVPLLKAMNIKAQ